MDPHSALCRVLRAVSRGANTTERVADKAGITIPHARTCLTRLRHKGYVRAIAIRAGQRGRFSHYEPVGVKCILADVWK